MEADRNTAGQRPPLHGNDSVVEIEEVLAERLPLYDEAMHLHVETDDLSLEEVAERICAGIAVLRCVRSRTYTHGIKYYEQRQHRR